MSADRPNPDPSDLPPIVTPAEAFPGSGEIPRAIEAPPAAEPSGRPGPGLGLAIAFSILLMIGHLFIGVGVALGLLVVTKLLGDKSSTGKVQPNGTAWAEKSRMGPDSGATEAASAFDDPLSLLALTATSVLTTLLIAVVLIALREGSAWRRTMAFRSPHPAHVLVTLLLVLPGMLVASEVGTFAQRFLPRFTGAQESYAALSQLPWPLVLLVGAVLPAVGEELFFRGLLGRGLTARYGVLAGVIITSILFGLIHMDPPQVLATALLAVPFHVLYLAGKSIWLPILAHGLNNALAFLLMRLPSDSPWRLVLGGDDYALLPPQVFVAALLAFLCLLWWAVSMRVRWLLPSGQQWWPGYVTAESPPDHVAPRAELARPGLLPVVGSLFSLAFLATMIVVARQSL